MKKIVLAFLTCTLFLGTLGDFAHAQQGLEEIYSLKITRVDISKNYFAVADKKNRETTLYWDAQTVFMVNETPTPAQTFFKNLIAPPQHEFFFSYRPGPKNLVLEAFLRPIPTF